MQGKNLLQLSLCGVALYNTILRRTKFKSADVVGNHGDAPVPGFQRTPCGVGGQADIGEAENPLKGMLCPEGLCGVGIGTQSGNGTGFIGKSDGTYSGYYRSS